jgi:PKD repeat protein
MKESVYFKCVKVAFFTISESITFVISICNTRSMKTMDIILSAIAFLILPFVVTGQTAPAGRTCRPSCQEMIQPAVILSNQLLRDNYFNASPSPKHSGSYVMDFETVTDFSLTFENWTVADVDKHDTYAITDHAFPHQTEAMAFLCFNPAQVNPTMAADEAIQPHSGQRFGACFSSNPPANNDWFVSPRVQLDSNGTFSFWVKSYSDLYGLDSYTVAVSVTDNNPASFTKISGANPLHTTTSWVKKTFDLSPYNHQQVYVAINCVSNDNFLMMIDDLEIEPNVTSTLEADFTADKNSVRMGETVNFTDHSPGGPVAWSWKFTGGTPATSTVQNPTGIRYSIPGVYPVSLKVSNESTSDSVTKAAFITVTGYPSSMSLDFEQLTDFTLTFSPWTVNDVGGGSTYGINAVYFPNNKSPMAYICFNPSKTTPPLQNVQSHSGQKMGCCFSSAPPMNPNNKWLISPMMSLGINPQIEFWVKTYNTQYGYERFNVAVSTTNLNPSSFVPLIAKPDSAPADWARKTYSLGNYTNQDVYIGIQCVTNDGFIFMLDDISITSTLGVNGINSLEQLTVFPNPADNWLMLKTPSTCHFPVTIHLISMLGDKLSAWNETPVSGKILLDIHHIPQGIYLLQVDYGREVVIRKISIIKK